MKEFTNAFYNTLFKIFRNTLSENSEKARSFRIQFEGILQFILNDNSNSLNTLLKDFYKLHNIKLVNDLSHTIKNELNVYHHPGFAEPADETLKDYFKRLINIVYLGTSIKPNSYILNYLEGETNTTLNNLNEEQKIAVLSDKKIVYVNAGPGTGKTHLLVDKIFHKITNSTFKEKIVALSYTNSTAEELSRKITDKLFSSKFIDHEIFSGTIHSFAFKCLRAFSMENGETDSIFTIIDQDVTDFFADEIVNAFMAERRLRKELINEILEGTKKIPEGDELLLRVEKYIIDLKIKCSLISFKDILNMFLEKLKTSVQFQKWIENKITFFVIDEAQDLTEIEYKIINLVNRIPSVKIFLVGDPRQNIFSFNGGSFEHLNNFLQENTNHFEEVVLKYSYRCPSKVFDLVNKFEFTDCQNYPINSKNTANCNEIELKVYNHKFTEAEGIAKYLLEKNNNSNTVILFTTLKYFNDLARELNNKKIPFVTMDGRVFIKSHIRFYIHFLKIIKNIENSLSWKYILKVAEIKCTTDLNDFNFQVIENLILTKNSGEQILNSYKSVLSQKENLKILLPTKISDTKSIFENLSDGTGVDQLNIIENDLALLIESSKSFPTVDDFLLAFTYSDPIFKKFYEKELLVESSIGEYQNAVTLSTIHSAKGLEWDTVIIPGLSDGQFPNPYFCEVKDDDLQRTKTKAKYNDELKKLYVAATRTKSNLVLTYPLSHTNKGGTFRLSKSRFLESITIKTNES